MYCVKPYACQAHNTLIIIYLYLYNTFIECNRLVEDILQRNVLAGDLVHGSYTGLFRI